MANAPITKWYRSVTLAAAIALTIAPAVRGENIDLSTVPDRESVQLTIYNSEDLTLVRETRTVSFKKGSNPLQFSWANTLIDPTSVELRFLTSPDMLEVLDTTFPHDKRQMLYWHVHSEEDVEATIEITYFTSGITWSADYVCVSNPDESSMRVEGFVRVTNDSGEAYENAQVRLVVGTINLVEKIAQLAQVSIEEVRQLDREQLGRAKQSVAMDAMYAVPAMGGAMPEAEAAPKEIIKEGLSEYFIYTIEGTETIPTGWSKRLRSFDAEEVPLEIEYRYRPHEYGDQLVRMYLITNDSDSRLGTTPLPDGVVRIFRENGRDGLSYLAEQSIKYVAIGDEIELNLGADPEVIFDLVKEKTARSNIWMQIQGTDKFQRVGENTIQKEANAVVAGWDERLDFVQRIRNYTGKPIALEVRRDYDGHVDFQSDWEAKLHDYRTVEYRADIPAGETRDLRYSLVQHHGRNAKQNQVTIVEDNG